MSELTGVPRRTVFEGSEVAGNDRFEAWSEAVSSAFVPLRAVAAEPEFFNGRLITQPVGQTLISDVCGSAMQVSRTSRSIAANDPGWLKLGLQLRGYSVVSQDDREAALTPGDFAIYDTSRPYDLYFDSSFRMLVVMFPAHLLQLDPRTVSSLTASRVSGRKGLGALTSNFLSSLGKELVDGQAPGQIPVSDAALGLITATFAERAGNGGPTTPAGVLRLQIESYIASHLGDPDLTVTSVAAAHNISVRRLQKVFEEQGDTVSGWIRRRRLEQCRKDLANPSMRRRPVAAVGMHWGFSDASSFSRAFKTAFGFTPAEYRYSFSPADGGAIESTSY